MRKWSEIRKKQKWKHRKNITCSSVFYTIAEIITRRKCLPAEGLVAWLQDTAFISRVQCNVYFQYWSLQNCLTSPEFIADFSARTHWANAKTKSGTCLTTPGWSKDSAPVCHRQEWVLPVGPMHLELEQMTKIGSRNHDMKEIWLEI